MGEGEFYDLSKYHRIIESLRLEGVQLSTHHHHAYYTHHHHAIIEGQSKGSFIYLSLIF